MKCLQPLCLIRKTSRLIPVLLLLIPVSVSAAPESAKQSEADSKLQNLIRELERNEALYQDLELKLQERYEQPPGNAHPKWKVENRTEYSILVQGQKFREEETKAGQFRVMPQRNQKNQKFFIEGRDSTLSMFDGTTYRRFNETDYESVLAGGKRTQSKRGEVSDLPKRLDNFARPHMLLQLRYPYVPLSNYLSGQKAMVNYPGLPPYPQPFQVKVQIEGTGEIQGLKCTKVVIEQLNDSDVRFAKQILWLAHERNLIPVKIITYRDQLSEEKPIEEAFIDEWQELGTGVWFPQKAHIDHYNFVLYKYNGTYELDWRRHLNVKQVTLHPEVQQQVFTKLNFPQGTTVRVRKDHKQSKYKVGEEEQKPAKKE
ncbi:LolA-like protein [Gimesia panareensis]|uniref:Uncharacterized protein n=1 Tax=Gimesia panareensis TaxID=2527978 RepID=A0A517QA59_9PLAN|nr:outer membrane lipoprotein-sorting protein [Gimesia panareensis]QDT28455.1 hypothetical protein Enr10x_37990 [Gimesia panareensis]QDU51315.1 hypothetical protein Pan110_36810 [Gimesia panareensis]